jgi:hypothetical protein
MTIMSMYVDMLSSAIEAWDLELTHRELLDHALSCRARMLATGTAHGASAYEALAAELAYDRALIYLCGDVGIGAGPLAFGQPDVERTRLEQTLAEDADLDLVALSRARPAELSGPPVPGIEPCQPL